MQTMILLLQLTVLCSILVQTEGQMYNDLPCVSFEAANKKKCYEDLDLDLTVMPTNLEVLLPAYESYETFFTIMDPDTHCEDPEKYRQAVACSLNVSRTCFDPTGTQNTVHHYDDVVAGMQRLCDVKDQVDSACFKTFFNTVFDCASYNFPKLGLKLYKASQKEITCSSADLNYDCMEILFKPLCGEATTNIYLEQIANYQLSPLCKNGTEPTRPRERFFQELRAPVNDNNDGTIVLATATTLIIAMTARWIFLF